MSTGDVILLALLNLAPPAIVAAAGPHVLPIRHKSLYGICAAILLCPLVGASPLLDGMSYLIAASVVTVVPLFLFSHGHRATRLYFTFAIAALTALSISLGDVYWSLTGVVPSAIIGDLRLFIGYGVLCVVVQMLFLGLTFSSFRYASDCVARVPADKTQLFYCGYAAIQLIWVLLCIGVFECPVDPWFALVGNLCVASLSFCSNLVLLRSLFSFTEKLRQKHQAKLLSHELEYCIRQYRRVEQEIKAVARVKHDIKNQVNILLLLLNQGSLEKARSFVCTLEERVCAALTEGADETGSAPPEDDEVERTLPPHAAPDEAQGRRGTLYERYLNCTVRRIPLPVLAAQTSAIAFLMAATLVYDLGEGLIVIIALLALCSYFINGAIREVNNRYDGEKLHRERMRLLAQQQQARRVYRQSLEGDLRIAREVGASIMAKLALARTLISEGAVAEACDLLRQTADERYLSVEPYCENQALNALLMLKGQACKEAGIRLIHAIDVEEGIPFADVDLCVLFSNLLDNAIAGCRNAPSERRSIHIKAGSLGGVLLVDVVNGCRASRKDAEAVTLPEVSCAAWGASVSLLPAPVFAIGAPVFRRDAGTDGLSNGLNRRGWGMGIIESLTDLYDGDFETSFDADGWFRATATLSCSDALVRAFRGKD